MSQTPFVADGSLDAKALLEAAGRFARSKGSSDEDMPSTMLLCALEAREKKPGQTLSLEMLWRKAYEMLHPRGSDGEGGRARRDAMDHAVDDVQRVGGDEAEERTVTECAVIDFGSRYTAIASTRSLRVARRAATSDLRRARYLARLPFGHLPFVL